jgi:hypothetical protein
MRRRVTFSRNVTLSLSRTCQCYCKYCAFKTHQAHLHTPEEVVALLDEKDDGRAITTAINTDIDAARRWFTSFGSCSVEEPLESLAATGILEDL